MIKLEKINRAETLRYLGNSSASVDGRMNALLDKCEGELLGALNIKYLYKILPAKDCPIIVGESARAHLEGCDRLCAVCLTLGAEVDKLIRRASVRDMAEAVALDAMASSAVESALCELDEVIAAESRGSFLTWRFSPGYGDYPLELQQELLTLLDAQRKIGLCADDSSVLTPTKSVTAIMGLSETPLEKRRQGCAVCNMKEKCKFRKAGTRCEF